MLGLPTMMYRLPSWILLARKPELKIVMVPLLPAGSIKVMVYILLPPLIKIVFLVIFPLVAVIPFSLYTSSFRFLMVDLSSYALGKYCKKSFTVTIHSAARILRYLGVVLSAVLRSIMVYVYG